MLLTAVGTFLHESCCQGCSEPYSVRMGESWIEMFIGAERWLQSVDSVQRDGASEVRWELCKAALSAPDQKF